MENEKVFAMFFAKVYPLLIAKAERGGRTYTAIRELDRTGRCDELARLTGGGVVTDALLASVGEMLDQAEKFRASLLDK